MNVFSEKNAKIPKFFGKRRVFCPLDAFESEENQTRKNIR